MFTSKGIYEVCKIQCILHSQTILPGWTAFQMSDSLGLRTTVLDITPVDAEEAHYLSSHDADKSQKHVLSTVPARNSQNFQRIKSNSLFEQRTIHEPGILKPGVQKAPHSNTGKQLLEAGSDTWEQFDRLQL